MKYERISFQTRAGIIMHKHCQAACNSTKRCDDCKLEEEMLKRLYELENKIDNNILVELPCKVGDKLYCCRNDSVKEIEVTHFVFEHGKIKIYGSYEEWHYLYICDAADVGNEAFHFREEAEKALVDGRGV
jgi:hypothetical protein